MKNTNLVHEMTSSGLLIALGVLIPMAFHSFGLGNSFLPMHIPALLAGFILSMPYAVVVGGITPLISSVITGMPPMFPVMPYMVFELATYAAMTKILYRNIRLKRMNLNIYLTLIGSMIAGRIVAGIVVWIMVGLFGAKLPGPFAFIASAVTSGIIGIIIQIVLIPPLIGLLEKTNIIRKEVS